VRIAFVSNEPPPYRIPVFRLVAQAPGIEFLVVFCCRREPNRLWDLPPLEFPHVFLRERIHEVKGRYIHNNPDVFAVLRKFAPDVVVTDGFNPTHLYAFLHALLRRRPHVAMTDGTDISEQHLGIVHTTIRRFVYRYTRAFVAASDGGSRLFDGYGIARDAMFKSCLCIDNQLFRPPAESDGKQVDFLFSGRLEEVKNPFFAVEVAVETAKLLGRRTSLLYAGAGSAEPGLREQAERQREHVDIRFHGFASQGELPALYRSARIFLFPTRWDPWGVVANEACAAGLPVIVSPHAGVSGELVKDGVNGFVCALHVGAWASRAAMLLDDLALYRQYADASLAVVGDYTYRHAAEGILAACTHAATLPENVLLSGSVEK
jgi:glycosyltransferase involved in cell wall biosynthesis